MDPKQRLLYTTKIEHDEPISLKFRFIHGKELMLINSLVSRYLSRMDHIYLLNSISTILREIIVNAMKANAKRIFFLKNNINISEPRSYEEGMKRFKSEIVGEFGILERELENSDYYIQVDFSSSSAGLDIVIRNNTLILPEELSRINLRIERAIQINDFSEAYEEIEDDTEGAGLGLVLTILFLKNMGIEPRTFTIGTEGGFTRVSLIIPSELRPPQLTSRIKTEIVRDVEGIPTFPENVIRLQQLCNDPMSSLEIIANNIMLDPALSADVIKLSNSAAFFPGKRLETVLDSVKAIGLKNVNALLVLCNARSILDKRYQSFEEIWNHLNRTAFYARNIAQQLKKQGLAENAFMAGLLHDLGKIVILSTRMNVVEKIAETVKNRRIITSTVMEEISIGISHPQIGALIAVKWNFPEYLVEAIKYHHAPLNSSDDYRDVTFSVYLANMLCGIEDRRYYLDYIDETVLERFGLLEESAFRDFHSRLKSRWEQAYSRSESVKKGQ
jgi:putative nucleotidyltransferase with HDIG domain